MTKSHQMWVEHDPIPDDRQDEDSLRMVTHYDPAMELIGQRAELARLRDVEAVARELVRFVNFESLLYHSETRVRARSLLARVRAAGFLSEVR